MNDAPMLRDQVRAVVQLAFIPIALCAFAMLLAWVASRLDPFGAWLAYFCGALAFVVFVAVVGGSIRKAVRWGMRLEARIRAVESRLDP